MRQTLLRIYALCLMAMTACVAAAQDVTALWDFQNVNPSTLTTEANIQGRTGYVSSTVDGVNMFVDATNGKLAQRNSDAQFNAGTKLQIPVKSAKDVVTVTAYPGYHNYTVGGEAATADVTEHRATTAEVAQGYVEVVGTGGSYLYSIQVVHVSSIQSKELYSTDFSEWGAYETAAKEVETVATWQTKYSHETLTFTVFNTQIGASNFNAGRFPDWTGGMLMCEKSDNPYIITSALASVTTVHFKHGATGTSNNRGWQLWVWGDGDTDWVSVSDTPITTAQGTDVTVNVNRTNCRLKFTNLSPNPGAQNAYLLELDIYGNVDMSQTPSLGSFTFGGTTYQAADICNEASDGTMTATIEVSKADKMPGTDNALTDITADNGEVTSTTYEPQADGSTVANILVTANGATVTYRLTFAWKPDYTLTYIDTDGATLGTQTVEKDAAIGTFGKTEGDVTVVDGKKFCGWFAEADGGQKYTEADVVTSDLSLYAVATDIETASATARYEYNLTDKYFYAEDHEAFMPENAAFHDTQHGWVLESGGKIDLLVGGHAYIILTGCRYSNANNVTLSFGDTEQATAALDKTADGRSVILEYTGRAGTVTLTADGEMYIHKLVIANLQDSPVEKNEAGYYIVKAGDAGHLLTTIDVANANASDTERTYIFLPDGTYDLGKNVLTAISGNNISIIGQSMENTIIRNAPDVKNEGIGTTATLYVTGQNTYLQDLTLQNALDYYNSGSAGRAVCLQDRGTRTICKNVKMLSYQDTYYSNNNSGQFYWEDSEIHGTVDFLCGGGDVYYNRCKFVVEPRQADGRGGCTIAAPYTDGTEWGYVMQGCTIDNRAESFNYGRAWGGTPRLAYLNTTLLQPEQILSTRFTTSGMNVVADRFVEYNTMNQAGAVVSPSSNKLTFTQGSSSSEQETIISAEEAGKYALDKVFTTWAPADLAAQKIMTEVKKDGRTMTWSAVDGAKAYAIFSGDGLVDITTATTYNATADDLTAYTVRAANEMGGFGLSSGTTTGISGAPVADSETDAPIYNIAGQRVGKDYKGLVIRNGKKYVVK